MTIETIGQLRAAIADLSDDAAFAVFSNSMDSQVFADCDVIDDGSFDTTCPTFMVFAEN